MRYFISVLLISFLVLCGCGGLSDTASKTYTSSEKSAKYEVTFKTIWSSSAFPTNFPSNRHFSGLIGVTHNEQVNFWEPDGLASVGMESMAETGKKDALKTELQKAIDDGNAAKLLDGGGISAKANEVSLEFDIDREHPLVTLVSMIAPSPDWFVGVYDYNLYKDDSWVDEAEVELLVYDAGTDDGKTFTSEDIEADPHQEITLLTSDKADTDFQEGIHREDSVYIGKFVFKRIK